MNHHKLTNSPLLVQYQLIIEPKANKNPRDFSNLRPISLLNRITKIIETIIKEYLEITKYYLHAIQQAANLTYHLETAREPINFFTVALLDIEKAYEGMTNPQTVKTTAPHGLSK